MTSTHLILLLGVFVIPGLLVWAGHKIRRRSPEWRSAFFGAVVGHVIAIVIGSVAAMTPPEAWAPTDLWRGALGLWSFAILPVLGGLMGLLAAKRQY